MNLLPYRAVSVTNPDPFSREEGVTEVPLILTTREAAALEWEARRQGMTAGELIRRLVRDYLER